MTSIAGPLAPQPAAVAWIEGDVETLLEVLLRNHGFEERSMMVSDGLSVPDGLFVQRETSGLLVWVPPEPERCGMDPVVLPPAVRVEVSARAGGSRIELHRVTAPATVVAMTSALGLSAAALAGAWLIGGAVVWSMVAVLGLIVWGTLVQQLRVASARAQLAWDALQPALEEVAEPEPALPERDPYR